eukprot:gene12062-12204_t
MGMTHQKLVEILGYAMVSAWLPGIPALMANLEDSLFAVQNVIEMPQHDHMSLMDSSRYCNREIISKVQQVICFAFHDSRLLLETCAEAKEAKKIVTLFYLD